MSDSQQSSEQNIYIELPLSTKLEDVLFVAAIIAYQQPVTRPQIDSIRGVNSDSMMKSLLHKGLILESGRADGPGRPILYSTTPEFLQHFGLNSILEMPSLAKPEEEADTHDEMLKGNMSVVLGNFVEFSFQS